MSGALKEVRERIQSVNNTQQITKAMKMVSAAKLRRAQMAITQLRPYADRLNTILGNVLSSMPSEEAGTSFGEAREVENVLMVVITSNRGLAGAFNTNINKAAMAKIESDHKEALEKGNLKIMPIGKKAYDFFRKRYDNDILITDHIALFEDLSFEHVASVAEIAMSGFETGAYDRVEVAYSSFKNAAVQFAKVEQFLPVVREEDDTTTTTVEAKSKQVDYIFEPNKQELLEELVPTILRTTFYKYILDTHASEHGARMTAMDKATENAEEMLKDLKISYNKARQEAITKELSEIVGGAAAL